ncbi:hypothetical protein BKM63_17230 [Flavobacterium johnsoniae]|uniref:Uncharacterized protein n=1 Tax=Flavobacterium johnsoniae TaxID=986 RepID=A0A1J7CGC4_FLAJO|nr:hypothetical protein BKM63_17230 [Flavobacterium johnsoniae]
MRLYRIGSIDPQNRQNAAGVVLIAYREFLPESNLSDHLSLNGYSGIFWELIPLSVAIFCAEPRHKRIFTAIGARV